MYSIDRKIIDVLNEKSFSVSAEVIPPRNGEGQEKVLDLLGKIVSAGVDFLSVTKGAGGSLRGGSLPITQIIKEEFSRPCTAHFTCRDLVPEQIENEMIDHHYFGIRNILALRGDPPMGVNDWKPREGGYSYAYELIGQIRKMNAGTFLKRDGFEVEQRENTDFCIGAAVYPEHPNPQERLDYAKIKFTEGAEYGITQMIFDPEVYAQFMETMTRAGVSAPIIPGVRILKSKKQAGIMESRFGCKVPKWYVDQLPETSEKGVINEAVLSPFYQMVEKLRNYGAPGIHIFVLYDVDLCKVAIKKLVEEK